MNQKRPKTSKPLDREKELIIKILEEESGEAQRKSDAYKRIEAFRRTLPPEGQEARQDEAKTEARQSIILSQNQFSKKLLNKIRKLALEVSRPFDDVYLELIHRASHKSKDDDLITAMLPDVRTIWHWFSGRLANKPALRSLEAIIDLDVGLLREEEFKRLYFKFWKRLSPETKTVLQKLLIEFGHVETWSLNYLAKATALPSSAFEKLDNSLRISLDGKLRKLALSTLADSRLTTDDQVAKAKPVHELVYKLYLGYKKREPHLIDRQIWPKISEDLNKSMSAIKGAYYNHLQWLRGKKAK